MLVLQVTPCVADNSVLLFNDYIHRLSEEEGERWNNDKQRWKERLFKYPAPNTNTLSYLPMDLHHSMTTSTVTVAICSH